MYIFTYLLALLLLDEIWPSRAYGMSKQSVLDIFSWAPWVVALGGEERGAMASRELKGFKQLPGVPSRMYFICIENPPHFS